jgi:type II secretory pathway pseudopilin PulG
MISLKPIHKTFTLIELLVVISIALVILSLLSPALKSTIRSANNIACASNLKSLGVLFETFAEDNNHEYLNNNTLFKLDRYGNLDYSGPMIRRSFKGWPSDLSSYDPSIQNLIYCPEDKSSDAIYKKTELNSRASYEFKGALIELSRGTYKKSVKRNQFGIPSRQSLLISRGTYHIDKVKGHHAKYDVFLMHNLLFVDGHISIDYAGYNHPNVIGTKIQWLDYPVYEDNKKARGQNDYLDTRCEVDESVL